MALPFQESPVLRGSLAHSAMVAIGAISSRVRARARAAFALDTRSLAAFRIAAGTILVADCLLRTRDFALMFTPDGMFPLDVLARYHADPSVWSVAKLIDASWWSAAVLATEGIAGLLLAAGAATRWATVLGWVALVSVIRRTAPATNAGDIWLATMLLWSMFLPLGATWSLDARRAAHGRSWTGRTATVVSAGSAALILQIVAVYLSAGLSKCNDSWLSGDAVTHALSVHDHGTQLGAALATAPWLARPVSWGTLALELGAPLVFVALPRPGVRLAIVVLFVLFHVVIWSTMTVGLFGPIGMAAWLALIPGAAWQRLGLPSPAMEAAADRWSRGRSDRGTSPPPEDAATAGRLCAAFGLLAAVNFVHDNTPWRTAALPRPMTVAVNALCLHQSWGMFGTVPRQQQWVYARAQLADGRIVDVLRGGRPVEEVRPTDGFLSLPHHRWHKMFWELPRPPQRVFSPSIAAAIARHWNATHSDDERITTLEIRFARLGTAPGNDAIHELLIATWPPRNTTGSGNLERLLEELPGK